MMLFVRAILFSLSFLSLFRFQSQQPQDMQQVVQKLVSIHKNWGEQMSTPGASIAAQLDEGKGGTKSQRSEDGSTLVPYLMHTKGLPKEKLYQLVILTLPKLQPQLQMNGIGLNAQGIAVCPGKPNTCSSDAGPDDPIDLVFPAAKGQVGHFALISEDGQSRAMFTVTPFPIRSTDKECTLELQRLLPRAELVYLVVRGLPPNSELEMDSHSFDEKQKRSGKADAAGVYETALMPAVQGKDHGTLKVTIASPSCAPSASIDWGAGSEHPQ
jgi:hypothetical protein